MNLAPTDGTAEAEIQRLKGRIRKLADEKSSLQLIVRLTERLNPLSGLDDLVHGLLYTIVEIIGGTNIKLYYWIEGALHYRDFLDDRRVLAEIDDPLAAKAVQRREFVESRGEAGDALLQGDVNPGAWSWAFPLLVGEELVGVIKLENVHISGAALRNYLPLFFSHAALILGNEIRAHVRRRMEEELRRKTEELDGYFNSALDMFCIADIQGYFRKLNPAWKAVLGYELSDLEGRRFLDFVHPDDIPGTLEAISQLSEQQPVIGFTNRYLRKDGEWRWIEWHSQPKGELIYAAARDITEKRRTQEELDGYREHLEELVAQRTRELSEARDVAESANRMKSVFLANMSHELRTPLNAILGFAQILVRDHRIPPDDHKQLETINRSGRHLLSLINDVLEISRIESGRTSVQELPFDLAEILHDIEEMIRIRAATKGLHLRVEREGALQNHVIGDPNRLRQVLINLLTNAVKYTDKGSVVLRVTREEDLTGFDNLSGLDQQIRFEVADTGPGIAAEDREKIFHAFYQTAHGVAKGEGTGLGLTISREFVRLMGGELALESEPGLGSRFHFTLPLPSSDAPIAAAPRGRVVGLEPGQPPVRLLVAEDHPDNRELIQRLLEGIGFEVRTAPDGRAAVEEFQRWRPHLIWMDMRMPVMDGYEATRQIRALPGGDRVRIAALTASAFQEDREGILAAGCDEMVAKPIEEEQFFRVMEELLGVRFRHEEEAPVADEAGLDLSVLPLNVRTGLAEAATALDEDAVRAIIERIRPDHPAIAQGLERLVDEFRFDAMLET